MVERLARSPPCPYPHLHEGLDIFASKGTPAVAVAPGRIAQQILDPVTGLGVLLSTRNGMQYLYAHLDSFAPGLRVGESVRTGQLVGFVGNTGDAKSGSPHLHFEARPGGVPMPPKPLVDRWLAAELGRARALLRIHHQPQSASARMSRRHLLLLNRTARVGLRRFAPVTAPRRTRVETSPLGTTLAAGSPAAPIAFLVGLVGVPSIAVVLRRRALRQMPSLLHRHIPLAEATPGPDQPS